MGSVVLCADTAPPFERLAWRDLNLRSPVHLESKARHSTCEPARRVWYPPRSGGGPPGVGHSATIKRSWASFCCEAAGLCVTEWHAGQQP
mmetsp:Transcript_31392/g.70554  ORF Transcript_31392/g.70554 Transcript_31392/m.70554 type:complete len:90 (-) Transcript_31392:67-336(-)